MSLPTNRMPGDIIEAVDINQIAEAVNELTDKGTSETVITTNTYAINEAGDYLAQVATTVTLPTGGTMTLATGDFAVVRQIGAVWYADKAALTPAPGPTPDTTVPVWPSGASVTVGAPGMTNVSLTLSHMAVDDRGIHAYEVSLDSGATWLSTTGTRVTLNASAKILTITGLTGATSYPEPRVRAKDAAGNVTTVLTASAGFTTLAESIPTGPVSATALSVAHDATSAQNYTFPGMALGAASTHRLVVACFRTAAVAGRSPSVCTIGGVPATVVSAAGGAQARSFAYAVVPTGSTGDVVVTFSGSCNNASVALVRVDNTKKSHLSSSKSTSTKTLTVDAAPDALILAALVRSAGNITWDSTNPVMTSLGSHTGVPGTLAMGEAWGVADDVSEVVDATVDGLTPEINAIVFEKAV